MTYEFSKRFKMDDLLNSTNLADQMDAADLQYVGNCALEGYMEDKRSREEWEERNKRSLELALQVMQQKTFPWPGASNVKFPLVTVAALQFQALAYPALIDAPDLVKCIVYGTDPDGSKTARAERIAAHMSWQNLEQDTGWEEAHDKGLLVQAIAGNAFFKKIFDPACRHIVTQLVLPTDFVLNYYTRDIDSSPRYTHTFELTPNAIRTRELDKRFRAPPEGTDVPKTTTGQMDDSAKRERDERQGLSSPPEGDTTPYFTGEQYCWWDLDGDGYAEPYIVTFDIGTGFVRRMVARFLPSDIRYLDGKVYEITPVKVFTKVPFVPSPDGGFYDLGLGSLLGPINESVNTALNQIFDAGTMATLGGGFLGRGFKNRAGPFSMRPFEWNPIDAPGDDLRKNILPLPVREPSPVLFQVLGLLIQYGERIISTNEIQAGENPGQNTPAETTRTLDANGRRMANAVYKRTWRAFRDEYRIQYDLDQKFLSVSEDYANLTTGQGAMIAADDYSGSNLLVRPAADPYIISDAQKVQQATNLLQAAQSMPGFNRYQVGKRWLKAMKVQDVDAVYPPLPPDPQTGQPMQDFPPPPPDPKMIQAQVAQGKLELDKMEFQAEQMQARIELMLEVQERGAKIINLQSQATLYQAQAKSEEMEPAIKLIYAQIESEASKRDQALRLIDTLTTARLEHKKLQVDAKKDGVNMPGIQSPADVVAQTNGQMLGSLQ